MITILNKTMNDKNNNVSLPIWIMVIIMGTAVYKQIDFETLKVKNLGLGIVYFLTFISLVILIVRKMFLSK